MPSDREREMAEAVDELESIDDAAEAAAYERIAPPARPSQVYSVRIPVDYIERLRRLAASTGDKPTALIRRWVIERLEGIDPAPKQIVEVHIVSDARSTGERLVAETKSVTERIDLALRDAARTDAR